MKIIPVDELIKDWTEEEREHLAPLIDECKLREAKIRESAERSNKSLEDIRLGLAGASRTLNLIQTVLDDRIGELAEAIYTITKGGIKDVGNA